jgi:allantoinase
MLDLVFRARRVITAFGEVDRCVGVQDGDRALRLADRRGHPRAARRRGAAPDLVDTHVHVNEPDRTG